MSWPLRPVNELCTFATDCVNKTAPTVDYETRFKMIRTTNVKGGFIDLDTVRYVTEETFEEWTRRSRPIAGDVVLTREAPVGEVGRVTFKDEDVMLGQRLFQYRPNPDLLDSNYLAYVLQSREVQGALHGKSFGATVPHVKVGDAEALPIPCPPLSVQQRIGNALAAYDDLIENNQCRIKLLEEAARWLFREWFVALRFPGHERVKVVDGVPQGWKRAQLDGICQEIKDLVHPSEVEPTSPYLSMEHMPSRSICLGVWETANTVGSTKAKFMANDVLFGKIRPYFHKVGIAQISGITSTDVIVMRAKSPNFLSLLAMIVSADEFVGHAVTTSNGTKMPRANWQVLRKWPILVPPEQLMADYAAKTLPLFNQIKMLSLQTRLSREARDALLPRLMSGALAV